MTFKSDNAWGVSGEILNAMVAANEGVASSYGQDEYSKKLHDIFAQVFDTRVRYFLTTTGTAANSLAIASICPSFGIVYCHQESHINHDECSSPEMISGGAKICPIPGNHGKIDPDTLENTIIGHLEMRPHQGMPGCISITQGNECGTVYSINEIQKIRKIAVKYQLPMHMDGARFANALVKLNCRPSDITSQLGIDVISFGGTKNGALAAEAVVFLNSGLGKNADFLHKKMGQLISKTRFFSAQFLAYLNENLWIKNGEHANKMAEKLAAVLCSHPNISLKHPCEINEIFAYIPKPIANLLREKGMQFYCWSQTEDCYRFVTSFMNKESEIDLVAKILSSDQAKQ
ncbi:MAG: low specificity L-threonine aldolase [Oligoflexales bacterium]